MALFDDKPHLIDGAAITKTTLLDAEGNDTLYTPLLDMTHSVYGSIQVHFSGGSADTAATLDLGLHTSNVDTVLEAPAVGPAGNLLTIALVPTGTGAGTLDETGAPDIVFEYEPGVTTVTNFETAITGGAELTVGTAGTGANIMVIPLASSLDLDGVTGDIDTIIEAAVPGAAGDDITIAFVADGTGAGTLDESAFPDIVFHFEDAVTTVTNFETAVAASTNLAVGTAGTGANVFNDPADVLAATNLASGSDDDDELAATALAGGVDTNSVAVTAWGTNEPNPTLDGDGDFQDVTSLLQANAAISGTSAAVSTALIDPVDGAGLYRKLRLKFVASAGQVNITRVNGVSKDYK